MTLEELLPILVPLIFVQLALMAFALFDLTRPVRSVKGGNKLPWGLVIVFGQLLGPLIYFLIGREED
jgi:hypothetical protein